MEVINAFVTFPFTSLEILGVLDKLIDADCRLFNNQIS